jgi:hypothetical protein
MKNLCDPVLRMPRRFLCYYPSVSSRAATISVGQVFNLRRVCNPPPGMSTNAAGESSRLRLATIWGRLACPPPSQVTVLDCGLPLCGAGSQPARRAELARGCDRPATQSGKPQPGLPTRGVCGQAGRRVTNPPQVENLPHIKPRRARGAWQVEPQVIMVQMPSGGFLG